MTILDQIVINKLEEIKVTKKKYPLHKVAGISNKGRRFLKSIENPKDGDIAFIGEIKLASPSVGVLGKRGDIIKKAIQYENANLDAISVVTDKKYFKGEVSFIKNIKSISKIPILAKDFILNPYQIYQMKLSGADAILLIVKILNEKTLNNFVNLSMKLGLEPVVEVNDKEELKAAAKTKAKLIAINSRNLNNFKIDIDKACRLGKLIPKGRLFLAFSGVKSREEIKKYKKSGAKAVLVGTALMKATNPKDLIQSLKGIQKPKIKICGIKTIKEAKLAISAGADYLGFIFVPSSKRFIKPRRAKQIIKRLKGVKIVGVFQNQPLDYVNFVAKDLNLDFVQLHGNEDGGYTSKINKKVIKVFVIKPEDNANKYGPIMRAYKVDYFMIDRPKNKVTFSANKKTIFNPLDIKKLQEKIKTPIFLSGGLNSNNIQTFLSDFVPFALDVSSGVETDGIKDPVKINQFIKNAKGKAT
ncbi:hypothetical protein HYS91_02150 [Candidatus Daviesbacteria bacterium]|nr:hypothetical protein [Candidatus Daviesbacteria bacterium]